MSTDYLFSYGTLQLEAVQMATFGRHLSGARDVLTGFEQAAIEVQDPTTVALSGKTHHSIARFTGRPSDTVQGTVYAVTPEELRRADEYEVAEYRRIDVVLQSGLRAWVYVDGREMPSA